VDGDFFIVGAFVDGTLFGADVICDG
jgi:hypothetical protein